MTGAVSVARAVLDAWMTLAAALPGGWTQRKGDVLATFSGVAVPALNGVWIADPHPDPATLATLLDEVGAPGLPHCVQCRPIAASTVEQVAREHGMTRDVDVPLMTLDRPGDLQDLASPRGLAIRQLRPDEAELHARVAAEGFEVPPEPFLQLMQPSVLMLDGVRCYLGVADGQAVVTGLGMTLRDCVGVFNIGTRPDARRRGYAAAVTVRAVNDGLQAGARWAWLQSSRAGYSVYERLGFSIVERWQCWLGFPRRESAS